MNWGWKIALVYFTFVILVLGMVFYVKLTQRVNLVSDEYYKDEIEYQNTIDAFQNAQGLSAPLLFNISAQGQKATLQLPTEIVGQKPSGSVLFFRFSDNRLDKEFKLSVDTYGKQEIDISKLPKGIWQLKIKINASDKRYQYEKQITI